MPCFHGESGHLEKLWGRQEALSFNMQHSSASIQGTPKVTRPQPGSGSKEEWLLSNVSFFFLVHVRVKRDAGRRERWPTMSAAILDFPLTKSTCPHPPPHSDATLLSIMRTRPLSTDAESLGRDNSDKYVCQCLGKLEKSIHVIQKLHC